MSVIYIHRIVSTTIPSVCLIRFQHDKFNSDPSINCFVNHPLIFKVYAGKKNFWRLSNEILRLQLHVDINTDNGVHGV